MKKKTSPLSQMQSPTKLAKYLERDVRAIALEEGRRVGSKGHAMVEEYLVARLNELGCEPHGGGSFVQRYTHHGETFTNIVGIVPGRWSHLDPLLIGAHYDSVIDAPCADDNAAAVAIALAVADLVVLSENLERDLIIAFFDAEEPPYFQTEAMGSTRFFEKHMSYERIHGALIMDLVGHDVCFPGEYMGAVPGIGPMLGKIPGLAKKDINVPFLSNLLFVTGTESDAGLIDVVSEHHSPKGLKVLPTLNQYIGDMSDHGVFRENGVPYLFLSCGHWQHYHMPTDTPDRLNYKKMAHITHYALQLLEGMDAEVMSGLRGKEQFNETLELEAKQLKRALGPAHDVILGMMGIDAIERREDMTRFVNSLLRAGL